jgi:hypothetical protein
MNRIIQTFTAVLFCLAFGTTAFAADDMDKGGGDAAKRQEAYLAALKKCDSMSGSEKDKCVEETRKKFGQM